MQIKNFIYLDHNATTDTYYKIYNPQNRLSIPINASAMHQYGTVGKKLIKQTAQLIAKVLNINEDDYNILFTSSCTEANNMIFSCFKNFIYGDFIISALEHKSVINAVRYNKCNSNDNKNKMITLRVNNEGIIDIPNLIQVLKTIKTNSIISIAHVNSESGVIQDIEAIHSLIRSKRKDIFIHTDCAQAVGKIKMDFKNIDIDAITFSGHKFGAPQGIGILVYKKIHKVLPRIFGGGQQNNIISGTENIFAIQGLYIVLQDIDKIISTYNTQVLELRNYLERELKKFHQKKITIISNNAPRTPNTTYLITHNVCHNFQLSYFDINNIGVSRGSACSSSITDSTPDILKAINFEEQLTNCGIRISLGCNNTKKEINKFIDLWKEM